MRVTSKGLSSYEGERNSPRKDKSRNLKTENMKLNGLAEEDSTTSFISGLGMVQCSNSRKDMHRDFLIQSEALVFAAQEFMEE